MTPSLSRGKGDATYGSSSTNSCDFYRMEKMYPDEPIPTASTTARAAAAAAAAAARDGRSTDQGKVSPPPPPRGLRQQQHPPQPIVYPAIGDSSLDSRPLPPPEDNNTSTAFHGKVREKKRESAVFRQLFVLRVPFPFFRDTYFSSSHGCSSRQ